MYTVWKLTILRLIFFLWEKTSKLFHHISSRQNPLHLSSCYCYGCRFWGAYRFPGFCGNQHIRDPTWSQNHPKSIPKQARKSIKELFCWFQMLQHDFMFLSFCIHLHASSFMFLSFACMFLSFCIHFLSCSFHLYSCPFILYSFHVHSNVHSFPFIFISFACMFLSFCINFSSCPFISLHFHMELALWLGQVTKCNKWSSLSYR